MSVLIKGMEMPRSCGECFFFAWARGIGQHCTVASDITFQATIKDMSVLYERKGDCPLIAIPPHGRLIDADAFEKFITQHWDEADHWIALHLEARPTIIEAEGEEP